MSKLPLQPSQLEIALQHGALHHFLAGDPPYFVHAKVDNEEPQNVQQAFDFSDVALLLQRKTSEHASALRQDTRWAGANWNSSAGLWEPMVKLALAVRDRLGGPDAVPIES